MWLQCVGRVVAGVMDAGTMGAGAVARRAGDTVNAKVVGAARVVENAAGTVDIDQRGGYSRRERNDEPSRCDKNGGHPSTAGTAGTREGTSQYRPRRS
jgi:hypothetical protein